jgi:molybdopterin/thiamine biosynthesis adenylyltransferase
MFKAESVAVALKRYALPGIFNLCKSLKEPFRMRATLDIDVFTVLLDQSNAVDLLHTYDIILDCTDNIATRYLISDTAVALGKPLVSGAAQKFEGN